MKLYLILLFKISFFLCFYNNTNFSYINNQDFSIKNAIYIIRNSNGNLNMEYKDTLFFENNIKVDLKTNFAIIPENNNNNNSNIENCYFIKDKKFDFILIADNQEIKFSKTSFIEDKDLSLWKIIPKINKENRLIYYVQNKKNNYFWELINYNSKSLLRFSQITEISNLTESNEFLFIELYKEVIKQKSKLLDDEPIDVFIKYIDLSDKTLNRSGIGQIKKDEDNQELRYSVRSVLQNLPWIRKIFILMPNDRVKYFRPKEEIQDKIVYVKDKDVLGFDSASIYAFLYNLYKMKKFGMTENFILMDDDYFIAAPLEKSDFFYEENGIILPALIAGDYYEMDIQKLQKKLQVNLAKRASSSAHSDIGFYIQQTRALLFMFKMFGDNSIRFGKKLIEPAFTHNAIPVKMSDIKELHDYVLNNYEYGKYFLSSLIRTNHDLQMHTAYMAYVKNKYDRKVNRIPSMFYDLTQMKHIKKNKLIKLFVINTSIKFYRASLFIEEKNLLEELFPQITEYELGENNYIDRLKKMIENNCKIIEKNHINIKNNISLMINTFTKMIDEYRNASKIEDIYEDIIKEEMEIIGQGTKYQKLLICVFLCVALLSLINKIYIYINKFKNLKNNSKRFKLGE